MHAAPARAHRRRAVRRRAIAGPPESVRTVATHSAPPAPPKPNWPIDQPPRPANVTWDSHGLEIEASNSSLDQILHEVATDTGAKLQGIEQDERIFGTYGPGPVRDVLSQLLDGSGYNVLMIGGQGDAPPQQIVLSKSAPQAAQSANPRPAQSDDEQSDVVEQPQFPMPMRGPLGNDTRPRTPQEIEQEMLMREQQYQQQQNRPQN